MVHFEIRFDPRYQTITTADIVEILTQEINPETSKYLTNLTIELPSLEVQESLKALNAQVGLQTTIATPPPTTTQPPPRRCTNLNLSYCKHLPYNVTSYPNILGHRSLADVQEDVIAFRYISIRELETNFIKCMIIVNSYDLASTLLQKLFHYRELVDAECYRLAYDFVCQILQPTCISSQPEDLLQLPCRSFCREFWNGCGNRLPDKFKPLLDCSNFPEYVDQGGCRAKPGKRT